MHVHSYVVPDVIVPRVISLVNHLEQSLKEYNACTDNEQIASLL